MNKVLRRHTENTTELLEYNDRSTFNSVYSDELGDLGLHQSTFICISFTCLTEIFRIKKIYLGYTHKEIAQTPSSLLKLETTEETV